jgi:hypothetical protein
MLVKLSIKPKGEQNEIAIYQRELSINHGRVSDRFFLFKFFQRIAVRLVTAG